MVAIVMAFTRSTVSMTGAVLLTIALCAGLGARAAEPFRISAPAALLIDPDSESILFARDADTRISPGAMTKLITLLAVAEAVKAGETSMTTTYKVSEDAWRRGGAPSGNPTMFAAVRSSIAVSDLMRGIAVHAGNDACLILAEGIDGNEARFAGRMTALARRIGMTNSNFVNVTGAADERQYSTLRDIMTALRYMEKDAPEAYAMLGEEAFLWNRIRQSNKNPIMSHKDGIIAGAAAGSDALGYGLVAAANRDGKRLILAVQGYRSSAERNSQARAAFDWAFTSFAPRQLFATDTVLGEASVFGGEVGSVPVRTQHPVSVLARIDGHEKLAAQLRYLGPLRAPLRKGDAAGSLVITRDGVDVLDIPVVAAKDVERGGMTGRAIDALYEIGVGLVKR